MSKEYIGCCGAYCKTCKPLIDNICKGCKLGYNTGQRDIKKAKCSIKVCCISEKKLDTCADCSELGTCQIIGNFYSKNGYKYKKYKQAIEFIRENSYEQFLKIADRWKMQYGKYE